MHLSRFLFIATLMTVLSCGAFSATVARAQDPASKKSDAALDRIPLFDLLEEPATHPSESKVKRSRMSVSELRQARALYRANQRVARFEYNLWMGREPLRPRWNAVPMMSSRYTNYKYYVPVYVYPR
jgi:hypothetical protein